MIIRLNDMVNQLVDENMANKGDNEMGRKAKTRVELYGQDVKDEVKEEVINMAQDALNQVAVGFQEVLDEEDRIEDEDMVQQHDVELVKEMENESDKIWDKGVKDGEMPPMMTLSEKMKLESEGEEDKGQMKNEEFNEEKDEAQRKKDELAKKRELRKLKQELKQNDLKLKESTSWSFSPVIPVYNQGEIIKYICTISSFDLASYFENFIIRFIPSIQRGSVVTPSGKEKDNFSNKHVNDIFQAFTKRKIFGNTIVLNYSTSNESDLVYNPEDNSITGEGYLQGIDFSHRARASIKWKNAWIKNPDQYDDPRQFQFNCEVNTISDEDARQMFAELNNFSLKVNPTRTHYLDNSNYANKIARRIEKESDLKNKIETVSTTIKSSSPNICSYGVLTNSIKKNYKEPQTKLEQTNVENWLIEYIDELVSIFPQFMANSDLESKNSLKKLYFTIEPLAMGAMIALSAVLKDDPDWKIKLAKLAKDDFFLRTDKRWRPVLKEGGKIINGTSSVKYFNETVINWCTK